MDILEKTKTRPFLDGAASGDWLPRLQPPVKQNIL